MGVNLGRKRCDAELRARPGAGKLAHLAGIADDLERRRISRRPVLDVAERVATVACVEDGLRRHVAHVIAITSQHDVGGFDGVVQVHERVDGVLRKRRSIDQLCTLAGLERPFDGRFQVLRDAEAARPELVYGGAQIDARELELDREVVWRWRHSF